MNLSGKIGESNLSPKRPYRKIYGGPRAKIKTTPNCLSLTRNFHESNIVVFQIAKSTIDIDVHIRLIRFRYLFSELQLLGIHENPFYLIYFHVEMLHKYL